MQNIIRAITSVSANSSSILNSNQEKEGPSEKKNKIASFQSDEVKANFQAALQSRLEYASVPTDSSPDTSFIKTQYLYYTRHL